MTDTPPHDMDAEKAVLGAMLLSADARQDVCELLTGPDCAPPTLLEEL